MDKRRAKSAERKIFELLDRKPEINNWKSDSKKIMNEQEFNGRIVFNTIKFNYPTRPQINVLNNISLSIEKGQTIALVGSNGSGKSTITQLLERFYNPTEGTITLSGENIQELDIHWLRSHIGIVSQEPILFDATIAENISYGVTSETATMDEIISAAKQADIDEFIESLPQVNKYKGNYTLRLNKIYLFFYNGFKEV